MKSAVIVFPGSNCDRDLAVALEQVTGRKPAMVWHRDSELPEGVDFIGVPGGFSYGDYLRSGAMAARSPIMRAVKDAAGAGRAGDRHLQRLPGADRSGAVARRADAQRAAELRLPARAAAGREQPEPVHRRNMTRARPSSSRSLTTTAIIRPTKRRSTGSKAKAAWPSATSTSVNGSARRHRRHPQRRRQCARPDAAPRAR